MSSLVVSTEMAEIFLGGALNIVVGLRVKKVENHRSRGIDLPSNPNLTQIIGYIMFYLKLTYIFHCVKNVSFNILIKHIFVILMSLNESTDDDNICKANILKGRLD